jgi:hypothetical protein
VDSSTSPTGAAPHSVEHDYYGVPDWLMVDYLTSLGGEETDKFVIDADGWSAKIRKAEPRHIGSLTVGGSTVVFTGEEAALEALFERLHWKTLRGGG